MFSLLYNKIKKAAFNTGLMYMCVTLLLMMFSEALEGSEKTSALYFNYDVILMLFVFSLIFGVSVLIFDIPGLNGFFKAALHLVINALSYYFIILRSTERAPSQIFVGVFLFIAVYFIIFGLGLLVKMIIKRENTGKDDRF